MRRVLAHVAPVGAEEEAPLRLAERVKIARRPVAHAAAHPAGARRELGREHLQQGGLAGAGLADHGEHLALVERGRAAGGRLVASRQEGADRAIARRLALRQGTPVVRLDFVRDASGVPLCAGTTWLPAARAPDAAKVYAATRSITRTLAASGIRDYRRHSTRVSAAIADAIDAARLDVAPGRPLLVVESVDVTPDGRPIVTSTARFAADRVELMVEY